MKAASLPDKRRWVVRCQCGGYEVRDGWALCHECGYTQKLLRGQHNAKKAAAAEQAIQEAAK